MRSLHVAARSISTSLEMSIRRWLQPVPVEAPATLPRVEGNASTAAANNEVVRVLNKKRKRGQYHRYDPELRVKIAKYACENGNKSTVERFSSQLGFSVSEATVRNFKRVYLSKLKAGSDPDSITSFPDRALGRPLLIGEFDQQVFEYIKQLRAAGGIVNRNIVLAAARGIISHKKPSLLKEYGVP